ARSAAASRNATNASLVCGVAGCRCRSEAIQTVPAAITSGSTLGGLAIELQHFGLGDDDVLYRNVLMKAAAAGTYGLDLVDGFGAFHDLAEYGIAPAARVGGGEVQEVVVGDVDEELRGSRMRIVGACHGQRVLVILQAVVG